MIKRTLLTGLFILSCASVFSANPLWMRYPA
ncbi:MAG: hypothetical protein H6Q18_136, partial [Bacteroidetes bacterium]|nr:hypothetical protein [Bacteroidota bacterium]